MKTLCLLSLVALFAACADTNAPFQYPDAAGSDLFADSSSSFDFVLPDGLIGPATRMYAHSQTTLFSIEPGTLALTTIGTFYPDAPNMNDLAVTPAGELYGISTNDLHKIDPDTAQVTHLAEVQGVDNVALTFEIGGTLLASDQSGALRRIDPQTGQITEIGSYGTDLGASGDLVAIKDGTLFGVNDVGQNDRAKDNNELLIVNPATGKATVVGPIGYDRVWGLAYWGGVVYGLTKEGELLAIDPQTGQGTLKQTFPYEFWGAAVTPKAPVQ